MIEVPELGDGFHDMWAGLIDLARSSPAPWTLIGAHMVALHGWALGADLIRASRDADILVNVRAVTGGTELMSALLVERGFEFDGASPDGVGHRFRKGEVSLDVLGPDGVGERARLLTIGRAHTVRVPGGTQALRRTIEMPVRTRDEVGQVPLPNMLGALLVKVRAIEVDDEPEAQREDVAFLLSLVADPDPLSADLSSSERGWMRRHAYFGDPSSRCYRRIDGSDDAAIVFRRLVS